MEQTMNVEMLQETASMQALAAGYGAEVSWVSLVIIGIVVAVLIRSAWKVYEKAKLPARGSLVPVYGNYLIFKAVGKPLWTWSVLFAPVFVVLWTIAMIDFAKKFGKGTLFGLGLSFFPFIFFPLLAFSDAQYEENNPTPAE